MNHGIDDATALIGMPELVVRCQVLRDGEWWLAVETPPGPGVVRGAEFALSATATAGPPCEICRSRVCRRVLVFARRRLHCREPLCEVHTWSEHVDAIAPRASMTERTRERLAKMVNIEESSIAAAGLEFGVGWHAANTAVADYTDPAVDDPDRLEGVRGIGVDEKRFLNATATHRTVFTTQLVDLDRHRLLDVTEGRSRDVLADWLAERGRHWCVDPRAGRRRRSTASHV